MIEDESARAVRAAVSVARDHGVRCTEPRVLSDGYSVVVHLEPSPVVARVPTLYRRIRPGSEWRRREVEVVTYLEERNAPVVPLSDELPLGPHERDGYAITFWRHVRSSGADVTEHDLAPALGELHRLLRGYPGPLPVLAGPAHDIPRCLEALSVDPGPLLPGQVELLSGVHHRLRPVIDDPPGPRQPLHGDVFPGNVIPTRDGLLWCDLEDVCLGPPAWDAANLRPEPSDRSALEAYPDPPTDEELAPLAELRALHVACFVAATPPVPGLSAKEQHAFLATLMARWAP